MRLNELTRVCLAVFCSLGASGCSPDQVAEPPQRAAAAVAQGSVPSRGADTRLQRWSSMPDSLLWPAVVAADSTVTVGIKRPGARRGIWKRGWLIERVEFRAHVDSVRLAKLGTVLQTSIEMPKLRLKLSSLESFARLRQLPFVDYVEPARAFMRLFDLDNGGCDNEPFDNHPVTTLPVYGDTIGEPFYWMHIPQSWQNWPYASGAGVRLAILDVGVWNGDGSAFNTANFTASWSADPLRTFSQRSVVNGWSGYVTCAHGTRVASIAAAPLDGKGAVGVAYRASVVSVHQSDDVMPDKTDAEQAIHDAVTFSKAKVVNLSWGTATYHDAIADEIRYHDDEAVFVGAAGTRCLLGCNYVVFPAEMEEVIAVTAADWSGIRDENAHYGPELDLVAYHELPTQGLRTSALSRVGGSSGAAAVVSGVAALVYGLDTMQSPATVKERVVRSGECLNGSEGFFAPMVNARAAVGGLCAPGIGGLSYVNPDSSVVREYSSRVRGGRSQRFVWSNGSTGYNAFYVFERRNYDAVIWVDIYDDLTGEHVRSTKTVHVISQNEGPFTQAWVDGPEVVQPPA